MSKKHTILLGILVLTFFCSAIAWAVMHFPSSPAIDQEVNVSYEPIRGEFKPLRLRRTGFTYKCSECHYAIKEISEPKRRVAEHTDLVLNHGSNDYCYNCHHPDNRDVYADHDGSEIPMDEPARLCGKCHGTIYQDWKVGAHGRMQGYWKKELGEQSKLLCIQCHDPHDPVFPKLKPLPGPAAGRQHVAQGEHHG